MSTWTDALTRYRNTTLVMEAIDAAKSEEAFDAAVSAQSEAIEALLLTPAPDLSAVAAKIQAMQALNSQHLLAPILADIERMSTPPTETAAEPAWGERHVLGYALPRTFRGISAPLAEAAENYRDAYFSTGERAGADTAQAALGIAAVKATSAADLAAKIMLGMLENEPVHRGDRLIIHLDDFTTDGAAAILLGAAEDAIAMIPLPEDDPNRIAAQESAA